MSFDDDVREPAIIGVGYREALIAAGIITTPADHDVEQQPRDYLLSADDDLAGKRERDPRVAYGYEAPPRRTRGRR
jgi:hypothetical protein